MSHLWRRGCFLRFSAEKSNFVQRVIGFCEKKLLKYHETAKFLCLQGTLSIKMELQWFEKESYNVIHFSIICNFYAIMYTVYY